MTSSFLVLLPPSETKSDGGNRRLSKKLHWPELDPVRANVRESLVQLAHGAPDAARMALKISPKLAEVELERNRALEDAPRKPAIERYTGVLYDAIDAATLTPEARAWVDRHVAIHSALYGLVMASDPIAAYRLSYDSKLPGAPLKQRWRTHIATALRAHRGPILDLRSKGYVGLGAIDHGTDHAWGDVKERLDDGSTRSLNHFNKQNKGLLIRAMAERFAGEPEPASLAEVMAALGSFASWERRADGVVDIVR
ncbi:YaaA family protein [Gulosibacter sp. ACHW.36C]|uniref:Peroxide stress protein YaaA n=1 Tax=Gulosibacter sediminis TaxID=1729695 RepID=A0ABY4N394_9MICO|nr:peroxide stress protein YaaA [Gulosibacter sediminis]UQN15922.1 peroxide stress protein YaaA [Gulosibacter sediminis]